MPSLNRVTLMGNLGADPELRYTNSGRAVADLRLAVNKNWTRDDGAKVSRVEWFRVNAWEKQAETLAKYLKKGDPLYLEGELVTRKWTDRGGKDRYTTEVSLRTFQFIHPKRDDGEPREATPQIDQPPPIDDADIPF